MAVKIGALLEKLYKKAGADTTSDELKPLFAIDTEVADEFANMLDQKLLTLEAAKGNPEINKLLRKNHFDSVDTKLGEIIKNNGVTVDEAYAAEPNTMTKIDMLSKALIEAGRKKAEGANKDGVQETLRKQAEDFAVKESELQKQLKASNETLATKEKEYLATRENDLTDFDVAKILLGKDYIFPKEMDSNVKVNTAYSTVKNELAKKGLILKRNEAGQLVITDKDGNPGYDDRHNKISDTNEFIDGVLAQNKLLKINDPGQQNDNGSNGTGPHIPNGKGNKNSAVINEMSAQLAKLPD